MQRLKYDLTSYEDLVRHRRARWHYAVFVFVCNCVCTPLAFTAFYLVPGGGLLDGCLVNAESALDALFFSFVTFATLGYGDITPIGICRLFAVIEALLGYVTLGLFVGVASQASLDNRRDLERLVEKHFAGTDKD